MEGVLGCSLGHMDSRQSEHRLCVRPTVHVGITGHRVLPLGARTRIMRQMTEVLTEIQVATRELLEREGGAMPQGYLTGSPRFRLISPLAEGADRLAARQALDLGYDLQCPLPFSQGFYEGTFAEADATHAEFRDLLNRAEATMEVAGGNEPFTSQAYADISSVVVNHSDFLLAVWDGKPNRYIAGTYAAIQQARRRHMPVIIIDASSGEDEVPVLYREDNKSTTDFKTAVRDSLRFLLFPQGEDSYDVPLLPLPNPSRIRILPRRARKKSQDKMPSPLGASGIWHKRKLCFSRIVTEMSKRYRALLIGRLLFPVLAIIFLTLALYVANLPYVGSIIRESGVDSVSVSMVFYALQVLCIIMSIAQVVRDRQAQYHRRYLCYRVMAELCRQTMFLSPMGFANVRFRHRSYRPPTGRDITTWYYRMLLREQGLPNCAITHADLVNWLKWVKKEFLVSQQLYHDKRARRSGILQSRLGLLSICFFVAGILTAVSRAIMSSTAGAASVEWLVLFASLALICPSVASFFASISQNAGYPMHNTVSRNMGDFFRAMISEFDTLLQKPESEIFYTDILRLCETIDLHCREELSDWEDSVRQKPLKWV